MHPPLLFGVVLAAVLAERLVEMVLSARHVRRARSRGGFVVAADPYGWIVAVHVALLVSAPLEVWLRPAGSWPAAVAWSMTVLVALAMALRYWAVATLGERWTTRVVCVPGLPAVTGGPYRWVRHPNYVAVALEGLALPLVAGAWRTALAFTLVNSMLLRVRIRVEEAALSECSDYRRLLGGRPRFLPAGEGEERP